MKFITLTKLNENLRSFFSSIIKPYIDKEFTKVEADLEPNLESNHSVTIDASSYAEPVEIIPEQGKDGMEKATVSITNIPKETTVEPIKVYSWGFNKAITTTKELGVPIKRWYEPLKPGVQNQAFIEHVEDCVIKIYSGKPCFYAGNKNMGYMDNEEFCVSFYPNGQ